MKTFLILLQLAASGTDAQLTDRNVFGGRPYHELNPIARPFFHSRAGMVTYFSLETGVKLGVPALLRHCGHRKVATGIQVWGIGDSAFGAAYSAARYREANQ